MTLWEYMSKEHGLTLLESEIHEILSLARQEIELPDEEDYINESMNLIRETWGKYEQQGWLKACKWYENKVRNPYPKKA